MEEEEKGHGKRSMESGSSLNMGETDQTDDRGHQRREASVQNWPQLEWNKVIAPEQGGS